MKAERKYFRINENNARIAHDMMSFSDYKEGSTTDAAWERNHELYQYVQGIILKIENILYGREAIRSDDEKAIEKLQMEGLEEC